MNLRLLVIARYALFVAVMGVLLNFATTRAHEVEIELFVEPQWTFDAVFNFRGGLSAVEYFTQTWGGYHDLGYVNADGTFTIPPIYRHAFTFYAYRGAPHFAYGAAGIMSQEDGGVAFFNARGERLTDFIFSDARNFSEGLAATQINGNERDDEEQPSPKWGFLDVYGTVVIPFEFDYIADFSEGLAMVVRDDRFGFIDANGYMAIPFNFIIARDGEWGEPTLAQFSNGYAIITHSTGDEVNFHWQDEGTALSIIDTRGNIIASFPSGWAMPFAYERAIVFDALSSFIIDTSGKIITYFDQSVSMQASHNGFVNGFAIYSVVVSQGRSLGFIDVDGDIVIPAAYRQANPFSEGLAAVQDNDGRWGFIDKQGHVVIPFIYDHALSFSEGFAAVMKWHENQPHWGYIDTNGNVVVPLVFQQARSFSEGLAWVGMPNPRYDEIIRDGDGFMLRGTEWGLLRVVEYGTGMGLPLPIPPDFNAPMEDEPEDEIYTPDTTTYLNKNGFNENEPMDNTYEQADIYDIATARNHRMVALLITIPTVIAALTITMWLRVRNRKK